MREKKKRYNIKKILSNTVWMLVAAATMALSGAAIQKKDNNRCKSVEITIEGVKNNFFINKTEVYQLLEKKGLLNITYKAINTFDLAGMESLLEKNVWIKSAELYFDNNEILKINITEREPVVRIFTSAGSSFYIDSSIKKLPLNTKFSARLPVFTSFPVLQNNSLQEDKKLLTEVKNLGIYIANDPFWMAQIEQIEITPQRTFEMIPKIGNQVIIFGTAENYAEKFNNLLLFYKKVQSKVGWNKYAAINISYKDQIIAVRREAGDIKLDSLKTVRLVKLLIANAQKQANESANTVQLEQPDENNSKALLQSYKEKFLNKRVVINDTLSADGLNGDEAGYVINPKSDKDIRSESKYNPNSASVKKPVLNTSNKKPAVQPKTQNKAGKEPDNEY